jgi:phage major head subunit gpT-like protein
MPAGNLYSKGLLDTRDLVSGFGPALETAINNVWTTRLGYMTNVDRDTVELGWLGQVPVMRKWIGGRHEEVLKKYAHSFKNFPYEVTLPFSVPDLRRDMAGILRGKVSDLAARTATHWDKIASPFIDTADAGTNGLAYDGQFFFDTDHNESGTNQSNDLTASEIPSANVADTTNVTVAEAANILNEIVGYSMTLTDDQGEPINQGPQEVTIVVTRASHAAAFRGAIGLQTLVGGVQNPIATSLNEGYTFRVIMNPRLTASVTIKFFFNQPGSPYAPLILNEADGVKTQLIGAGSEEEFKNNRHLFGVTADRGIGYGLWQKAFMVTLS